MSRLRPRLSWRPPSRRTRITLLVLGLLIALIAIGSFFVDEPLRRQIESRMNQRMKGYTVRIERLSFHPLGFGVTLSNLSFSQNAHPDPAVLGVKQLDAGVEWKSLIHAKLVANFRFEEPKLHVNLEHLREEIKDPTPLKDRGWQDAFEAIYPLKINAVVVVDGEAVYVDPGPFKPLRVSDQRAEGVGKIHLTGRFMGSGPTQATMSFRPTPQGPDLDLALKLEDTDMRAMNPILRQYGKFDVVDGKFSLYAELHGKGGQVAGYVKPLFKDVKAYDPAQDEDKSFVKKLYEKLVTGVSKLLKNIPRKEVATKVDVEGRLDEPQTSVLQAIGNLLRNAFIKAILPGLEREAKSKS